MANVAFQLEEQLSDLRSNEIAYRFTVENRGSKTIQLHSLTPRVAEGVTLREVKDTSERAVLLKHEALCADLTATLNAYLIRNEKETRRGVLMSLFTRSDSPAAPKLPAAVIRDPASDPSRTIDFVIQGVNDAETALATWLKSSSTAEDIPEKKLFEAKLTQLRRYDSQIETEGKGGPSQLEIATLTGGAVFATTFVFNFARGLLEPRKYTVTVETSFQESDSEIVETGAASASMIISPRPLLLSCIAMVSSVLGAILKGALHAGKNALSMPPDSTPIGFVIDQLYKRVVSLETLGGMIIALVIFNVYEHTEFGARVKMGVGWRSALLIGVLAGLFTERFLAALVVFIGGPP